MFVQFESVVDLASVEVPDDDFSNLSWEGVFCAGQVFAVLGYFDGWIGEELHEIL